MKNPYFLGVITSTVFLAGLLGGQALTAETVLATSPILDPLNPKMEIEPIDRLEKAPETVEPLTQSEDKLEPEDKAGIPIEQVTANHPKELEVGESVVTTDPLVSKGEFNRELVTEWERLGLNVPKLVPATHREYQKKFVTDTFFNQALTIPPDVSGDDQEISSELSRICYVMSGRLIFGRQGTY